MHQLPETIDLIGLGKLGFKSGLNDPNSFVRNKKASISGLILNLGFLYFSNHFLDFRCKILNDRNNKFLISIFF